MQFVKGEIVCKKRIYIAKLYLYDTFHRVKPVLMVIINLITVERNLYMLWYTRNLFRGKYVHIHAGRTCTYTVYK